MSASNIRSSIQGKQITLQESLAQISGPEKQRFAQLFQHGSLSVGIYAPREMDSQNPHMQDEGYIVIQGTGDFVFGDQRVKFAPGDFLFAPAGAVHRFEKFSGDLAVWVIFYGPDGGENNS